MRRALRLSAAVLPLLLAVVGLFVVLPSFSDAADPGALRDKLGQNQAQAQSLSAQVARLEKLERALTRQVTKIQARQAEVQADLDADQAELERVQADLEKERARALRLRKRLAEAREVLATRMLERYKAPEVDAISVVLNSTSFADLMERTAFLKRIQQNDEEIVVAVKTARRDAIAERRRLDAAEARQARIVEGLRARRNAIAKMAEQVSARQATIQRVRSARQAALAATRARGRKLRKDLERAEREAAAAAARAAEAAQQQAAPSATPSGGWAIPEAIVMCESGGQNLPPNHAGASGYYQFIPSTWKGLGGKGPHAYLRPKAEQDALAAKLWNGGKGASNWDCAAIVGIL